MKKKVEVNENEWVLMPQNRWCKIGNLNFRVYRDKDDEWCEAFRLAFGSNDWEESYICVKDKFKSLGEVLEYIDWTFGASLQFGCDEPMI